MATNDSFWVLGPQAIQLTMWGGEKADHNRSLAIYSPCPCGCSPEWYISGSNENGSGITITLPDEHTARQLAKAWNIPIVEDPDS